METLTKYILMLGNNMKLVFTTYYVSLIIFAAVFCLVEDVTFFKSIYFGIVTSFTIGYGDITPKTDFGIFFTSVFIIFWNKFIIPLIIVNILLKVIKDSDKFTDSEQRQMFEVLSDLKESMERLTKSSNLNKSNTERIVQFLKNTNPTFKNEYSNPNTKPRKPK